MHCAKHLFEIFGRCFSFSFFVPFLGSPTLSRALPSYPGSTLTKEAVVQQWFGKKFRTVL
jgi:hypothetical protein